MKYRYLGRSGLLVSRVGLGTMTFGMKDWGCDQETSTALLNRFVDAGGNFIDTADAYSDGVSEQMLGEAIREHDRDELVIATKCYFRTGRMPNAKGLSRKHIIEACEASLRRLGSDYIDLYQVHGPDPHTPYEETMRALDDLVRKGLVRYVGCSNFFAWQIVKANAISDQMNFVRFCSAQHLYNLIKRDVEREILPACQDQGLGLICWSPLGGGFLTGKYPRTDKPETGTRIAYRAAMDLPRYWKDEGFELVQKVVEIGQQVDRSAAQVALAWLLADRRVTAVIVGARKADQLDDNLDVGDWDLSDDQHRQLVGVSRFEEGYPMEWIKLTYPATFDDSEFSPGGTN